MDSPAVAASGGWSGRQPGRDGLRNPLRGRPERAPSVPVGSAVLARTDAADAHGWRVHAPGTVIYEEWIDHDPANGEIALTRL